jgi:UDP-2,3-diacylglucosamine pyrophosphatase LpxH
VSGKTILSTNSTSSRLSEVFSTAKEIHLHKDSKIILFSDCHRGVNDWTDDFAPNQQIFFHALGQYFDQGFTYIEVGDGEELWENRSFDDIRQTYSHIYWLMSKFHQANRLHFLWGNHNLDWEDPKNVEKKLYAYYNEREGKDCPLFPHIEVREGLILRHAASDQKIFITHGHQGDPINDRYWKLARFLVQYGWRQLQILGVRDRTSPAKNFQKRSEVEAKIIEWVASQRQFTICGHTHRPTFPKKEAAPYFNTGSCVHPRCITGIEIQNDEIALIKWSIQADRGGILQIVKDYLEGPERLGNFF